jgi:hypothetical protein
MPGLNTATQAQPGFYPPSNPPKPLGELGGYIPIQGFPNVYPSDAFDGQNYLVVWQDDGSQPGIYGAFFDQNGNLVGPSSFLIAPGNGYSLWTPDVAFDGTNYLVVWDQKIPGASTYYVIQAILVSPTGQLIGNPMTICPNTGSTSGDPEQRRPAVAYGGGQFGEFLVTWVDKRDGWCSIYGATVSVNGVLSNQFRVSDGTSHQFYPAVAFGQGGFLVTWDYYYAMTVRGTFMPLNSSPGASFLIDGSSYFWASNTRATSTPASLFVTYGRYDERSPSYYQIMGAMVNTQGLLGMPIVIHQTTASDSCCGSPAVAFDGKANIVVWEAGVTPGAQPGQSIEGMRLWPDGLPVGESVLTISSGQNCDATPRLACGDTNSMITWFDCYNGEGAAWGKLISALDIVSVATCRNGGRHLSRAPNSQVLNWVYQSSIGTFIQSRGIDSVSQPHYLSAATSPTIAQNETGLVWVCAADSETLDCHMRRADASWKGLRIPGLPSNYETGIVGAPSLALAQTLSSTSPYHPYYYDMGYAVYTLFVPSQPSPYQLYFVAFDSLGIYYYDCLDASNDPLTAPTSPSIAVTPADYIHVTWQEGGVIYYSTTLNAVSQGGIENGTYPQWSNLYPVSSPTPDTTVMHPFVEADGERVYFAWRGPNPLTGGPPSQIWENWGVVQPGSHLLLNGYAPLVQTNVQSDNPVLAWTPTGVATAWESNVSNNVWAIAGYINGSLVTLSNTADSSDHFPHAVEIPQLALGGDTWAWDLSMIYTESIPTAPGQYEVGLHDYIYLALGPSPAPQAVLDLKIGESIPSLYCVRRDGYDRSGKLPVDYADSVLYYRLPYMNPRKYYVMEAVAYQTAERQREAKFAFADGHQWDVTIPQGVPETLRIVIPPGIYDSTCVGLSIRNRAGSLVTLASLKLYEFEIFRKGGDELAGVEQSAATLKPSVVSLFPNPFCGRLTISYSLPRSSGVSINVYDVSGKLVNSLASGRQNAGVHTAVLDASSGQGDELSAGLYFVRFAADGVLSTRKIVLTR